MTSYVDGPGIWISMIVFLAVTAVAVGGLATLFIIAVLRRRRNRKDLPG